MIRRSETPTKAEIAAFRKRLLQYIDRDGDMAWLSSRYFKEKISNVNDERVTLALNDLVIDGILEKRREVTRIKDRKGYTRCVSMNWYRRKGITDGGM